VKIARRNAQHISQFLKGEAVLQLLRCPISLSTE